MDKKDSTTYAICSWMQVPDYPNVFFIGGNATRVTFSTQQIRALNLVWALHCEHVISAGKEVAIVGGGLAGATAALAASEVGCIVHIFERMPEMFHLQRGAHLRYVHPNIHMWPDKQWDRPSTDLPCLNWRADTAANVAIQVEEQWREFKGTVHEHMGSDVSPIRYMIDRRPLLTAEGKEFFQRKFDCVIIAAGFGLESDIPPLPFVSYWENDNYGRHVISQPIPRRFLVSGLGDGGCIDAIRLSLRDFDAKLIEQLLPTSELTAVSDLLLEIEKQVYTVLENDPVTAEHEKLVSGNTDPGHILDQYSGAYLWQEYDKLPIPNAVIENIKHRVRKDTTLILNDSRPSPLTLGSFLINRFLLFILRKHCGINFVSGHLEVCPQNSGGYTTIISKKGFPNRPVFVDEVVVRHGTRPAVNSLFPATIAAKLTRPSSAKDLTCDPHYPSDFYNNGRWKRRKDELLAKYKVTRSRLESTLHEQKNAVVLIDEQLKKGAKSSRKRTPLRAGESICLDKLAGEKQATLSCFVSFASESGKVGIMCTASGLTKDAVVPAVGDEISKIDGGELIKIAKIRKVWEPVRSPSTTSLSADTVKLAKQDFVFAELLDTVDPEFVRETQMKSISVPTSGRRVIVISSQTGMRFAKISGIDITKAVSFGNSRIWYYGAFEVTSEDGQEVVVRGDSGSSVVEESSGNLLGIIVSSIGPKSGLALPVKSFFDSEKLLIVSGG